MKRRLLPVLIAAVLSLPVLAQETEIAEQPSPALPAQELTPRVLYEFLLAELAGSRGQLGLAMETYMDLARTTHDPRIARRAAEIALFGKRYDLALEATRLWSEADPASPQPRQMLTSLLAATGHTSELDAVLTKELAGAGNDLGVSLLQINRVVARHPDKKEAQGLVDKLTQPYVGVAEAHFARAQAAHSAGDSARSVAELDQALILRPDWEQAALARVQMTKDPEAAASFLGGFVAANPAATDARLAYARSLVAVKKFPEARQQFQALMADHPENGDVVYAVAVLSLQLRDTAEAEKQLKRLIEMNHRESDTARVYLGQIEEERHQPDEALKWYGSVGAGSQYLSARQRMAHVLVRQQKLDEARRTLRESTAGTVADRAQLLIIESQMLRDAGRNEDAYVVLADGLAAHPDQPELLYEVAIMAEKTGRLDVVEPRLRRLIELRPDSAHAYNALGYSLADRNERLDEAQRLIDKALQLAPEDPFILDSKGWVLFRRGDTSGALDVLKKAFTLRADPEIAAHLGEVLWALGRKDEARQTWDEAIKASPGNEVLVGTVRKFDP
ncbi:MAG: tetratricopeptide repeat protein [Gammaproteobacteria bacterium]|nr:tetratricopeptide repeat protein [Gammaproteobacteria bacterium]MBU1416334.1 tetratricopeptide repeat protein [Gammaproteobacteria bacterium]